MKTNITLVCRAKLTQEMKTIEESLGFVQDLEDISG